MFDERTIETAELTHQRLNEGAIARIRGSLVRHGGEDCSDCGDPIPAARRAALPSAERCIECQQRYERSRR